MVSLDINFSATQHSSINGVKENKSEPAPEPEAEAEVNESNVNAVEQNESEPEAEVNESNAGMAEISKNATFGHNFKIDISNIYHRRNQKDVILDVKNTNEKCFLFCVAASLNHHKFTSAAEKQNPNNYVDFINQEFNTEKIEFPIKINQIQQFVNQNSHHRLSINIYTILGDQVKSVLTNVAYEKGENLNVIDLLAVFPHSKENKSNRLQEGHFMLITNPCQFFRRRQKVNSGLKKRRLRKRVICPNCKIQFVSENSTKYKNHKHFCSNEHAQIQDMPNEDFRLAFGKLNVNMSARSSN